MKNYIYLLAFVVVFFVSCDLIKDATKVEIETDLNFDVPVETTSKSGLTTKSANAEITVFPFVGSGTLSLADNDDLSDYIDNIEDILVNGVSKITIINVPPGGKITTCTLKYGINPNAGTTGFNVTNELTANNGTIEITDVAWINELITLLKQNKTATFKFVVSGESSYDIQTIVQFEIPVIIEANPL